MSTTETQPIPTREQILALLSAWVAQRPGLEPGNYDPAGYRADSRAITRQRHDFNALLSRVGWSSITAEQLVAAFRASSGRLKLEPNHKQHTAKTCPGRPCSSECDHQELRWKLDYCTGQYWCVEYRAAACRVLASALWDYYRDECMPAPKNELYDGLSGGEWLRRKFRAEFGRSIQQRWFD